MSELTRLEKKIDGIRMSLLSQKKALTLDEVVVYTGMKKSYLYKLTHERIIPFYKPNGKTLFFNREEIDEWLLKNKSASHAELEEKAQSYIINNRNR